MNLEDELVRFSFPSAPRRAWRERGARHWFKGFLKDAEHRSRPFRIEGQLVPAA